VITNHALNASISYAKKLADNGQTIQPVPNSLLSTLVGSFSSELATFSTTHESGQNTDDDIPAIIGFINEVTQTNGAAGTHCNLKGEAAQMLADSTANQIKFIRSVVLPVVKEYEALVRDRLSVHKYRVDPMANFNVEEIEVVCPQGIIAEELSHYDGPYTGEMIACPFSIPAITPAEVMDVLSTGDKETDQFVLDLINAVGTDKVISYWNGTFSEPSLPDTVLMTPSERYYRAIFVYLFGRRLCEIRPDVEIPREFNYQDTMELIRDRHGNIANKMATTILSALEGGALIERVISDPISQDHVTVKVYAQTYQTFLNEGGRVEALLGMVISDEYHDNFHVIKEKMVRYVSALDKFVYLRKAATSYEYLDTLRTVLKSSYIELLDKHSDAERSAIVMEQHFVDKSLAYLEEELSGLSIEDLDNIERVCRNVIARARFYYTDAYDYLTEMISIGQDNENYLPEEAAMVAAIHYLVDFIAEQISVGGR